MQNPVGTAGAFLFRAPPLREVEALTPDPSAFRFWALLSSGMLYPPIRGVARFTGWLYATLPRAVVYRCWLVPLFVWFIVRRARTVTKLQGRASFHHTGLSPRVQFRQMVRTCLNHPGLMPDGFYLYSLYRADQDRYAQGAAHVTELRALIDLAGHPNRLSRILNDKSRFHDLCVEHGLPTPAVIATLAGGSVQWKDERSRLPEADLFFKPNNGSYAEEAVPIEYDASADRYQLQDDAERWVRLRPVAGRRLTGDELLGHLETISSDRDYVLQERLRNHEELVRWAGQSDDLMMVRLLSTRRRTREFEVIGAMLYLPVTEPDPEAHPHDPVVVCGLDLDTGRIASAYRPFTDAPVREHPTSGVPLPGTCVPFAGDLAASCLRAHEIVAECDGDLVPVVGWDVAITSDGLAIIEGNAPCDPRVFQKCTGPLWENEAFLACVRSHLEEPRRVHVDSVLRKKSPPWRGRPPRRR